MSSINTLTNSLRNESGNAEQMPAGHSVRILVLPRGDIRPLFYFEPTVDEEVVEQEASDTPYSSSRRFRNWIKSVLERVRHGEKHVPGRLRRPLAWLKSRLPADERLLMTLRRAEVVQLIHPTGMNHDQVSAAWSAYLDSRLRRRIRWFLFYAVILIPSVMLAVLPGPNVFGFWVTYRLVAHGIAIYSVRRASKDRVAVELVTDAVLDGPILTERNEANRIQEHFQMLGLKPRLKRERIFARLRSRKTKLAREKSEREEQR